MAMLWPLNPTLLPGFLRPFRIEVLWEHYKCCYLYPGSYTAPSTMVSEHLPTASKAMSLASVMWFLPHSSPMGGKSLSLSLCVLYVLFLVKVRSEAGTCPLEGTVL